MMPVDATKAAKCGRISPELIKEAHAQRIALRERVSSHPAIMGLENIETSPPPAIRGLPGPR